MQRTDQEGGLGVIVEKSLEPSAQCVAAVKKGNRRLGYIDTGIQYKAREVTESVCAAPSGSRPCERPERKDVGRASLGEAAPKAPGRREWGEASQKNPHECWQAGFSEEMEASRKMLSHHVV